MFEFFATHPNAGVGAGARKQAIFICENNLFFINDRESDIANNLFGPLLKKKGLLLGA